MKDFCCFLLQWDRSTVDRWVGWSVTERKHIADAFVIVWINNQMNNRGVDAMLSVGHCLFRQFRLAGRHRGMGNDRAYAERDGFMEAESARFSLLPKNGKHFGGNEKKEFQRWLENPQWKAIWLSFNQTHRGHTNSTTDWWLESMRYLRFAEY